jgi:hypothetical protein
MYRTVAGNCDEIDVELLIGAVKNYPEIWNVINSFYGELVERFYTRPKVVAILAMCV